MALRRLQVTDFRCLQKAEIDLDDRFTLVSGPNATGKTSLLEAIYLLGRGRSFRTRRLDHLIRHGCERFIVFGEVQGKERQVALGVEGGPLGIRARIGAADASLAELALVLPVQIIDPEVHKLIEEGPSRRRRYLDWGVFHVEPRFIADWQRYHQVLKQRNAALKSGQSKAATSAWDGDLLRTGEQVTLARSRYVSRLMDHARETGRSLLGKDLMLSYRPGWARDLSFAEALTQSWNQDTARGATQVGPQRAEMTIMLDGMVAKDHISRGQQKLLAAALLIAQIQLFPPDSAFQPSLLLDDPAAELDDERLAVLIDAVSAQPLQLIVTTLHDHFTAFGAPGRRFRLHAGQIESA
jgi:DNA replication and repair protein RecF